MGYPCVYLECMRFIEKLRRRVNELGVPKARLAESVGLKPTVISSYLAKPDSIPRADIGCKIAQAIHVPCEWLFDDKQDWPPPEPAKAPTIADLPDQELMLETARRWLKENESFLAALDEAEKVDWDKVAAAMVKHTENKPLPGIVSMDAWSAIESLETSFLFATRRFDPRFHAMKYYANLNLSKRDQTEFDNGTILNRIAALKLHPGYRTAHRAIKTFLSKRDPESANIYNLEDVNVLMNVKQVTDDIKDLKLPAKPIEVKKTKSNESPIGQPDNRKHDK